MDRLFLDANDLFSAAYRADAGVVRIWALDDTELLSSGYAVEEARRNLGEPERNRLATLVEGVRLVPSVVPHVDERAAIELPDKNWPIVGAAAAASATRLITGDKKHFGRYFGSEIFGVRILPPSTYLKRRLG